MAYTTKTKTDSLFGITIPQAVFDDILSAVKLWIDKYCGKTFEAVSEDRYYDGNGERCLIVDSFIGTPTVVILNTSGGTERTLTMGQDNDFVTAPYNSTEKHRIQLTGNGYYPTFPARKYAVKITASFGVSASVPADIQLVATKMVGQVYMSAQKGGDVQSLTLGDYQVTYSNMDKIAQELGVNSILDNYRDLDI